MNSGCWGRWQQVHRRHGAWDQGIDQHGAVIRKFLIAMEICPAKHGHPTSFGECKLDILRFSFIGKRIWGMGLNLSWTGPQVGMPLIFPGNEWAKNATIFDTLRYHMISPTISANYQWAKHPSERWGGNTGRHISISYYWDENHYFWVWFDSRTYRHARQNQVAVANYHIHRDCAHDRQRSF